MGNEFFKSASVYPFHDYAVAKHRMLDLGEVLAYSYMIEREPDVEVLIKKFLIKKIASEFLLQGFINKEASVLAYAIQLIEPIFRNMDEFKFVAVMSGRTGVDWKKES